MRHQSMMIDIKKNNTRKYDDKFYTNFRGLNVPGDDIECESFTIISFDFLLV